MSSVELYEVESQGDYFTWTSKQKENAIYSRIDRVLANGDWMQQNLKATVININSSISYHSMIVIKKHEQLQFRRNKFKFINYTAELDRFYETISTSWNILLNGKLMFVVWKKLLRLHLILKEFSRPLTDISVNIEKARDNLDHAQEE